jgi:hypothetical protein
LNPCTVPSDQVPTAFPVACLRVVTNPSPTEATSYYDPAHIVSVADVLPYSIEIKPRGRLKPCAWDMEPRWL